MSFIDDLKAFRSEYGLDYMFGSFSSVDSNGGQVVRVNFVVYSEGTPKVGICVEVREFSGNQVENTYEISLSDIVGGAFSERFISDLKAEMEWILSLGTMEKKVYPTYFKIGGPHILASDFFTESFLEGKDIGFSKLRYEETT
jgi:hypothetical protein